MSNKQRILVMSHGHPDFSLGGGEIAAYNLFNAYRSSLQVENAWFLARADRGRGATGQISMRRANEYLWEQGVGDYVGTSFKAIDFGSVVNRFRELIASLRPTLVHTHHYAHFGLEYLRVIKQVDPTIRIMMTLHEYMAICGNNGQMVKRGSFKLCNESGYEDCRQCFPEKSAEDFWLRKHYFTSHFELVDQFVAPSEFLRQRYIAWGLPAEKIVVIENGQSEEPPLPPRQLRDGEARNRFGFFGQINPYKGLDVLLKALHELPKEERKKVVLEVHGANLEHQTREFQDKIEELRKPLIKQGVVQWFGPYQPNELRDRMGGVDWVVVPSIWWENSPMVIQEAFSAGRPLLVSNLGGMAEKVRHGVDGYKFSANNSMALSKALQACAESATLWSDLRKNIITPLDKASCARNHLALESAG